MRDPHVLFQPKNAAAIYGRPYIVSGILGEEPDRVMPWSNATHVAP
jgi:hypothetical protein